MLMAWLAVGGAAVLSQTLSWWQYHFLLFSTPLGLLGIKGLDLALPWLRSRGLAPRAITAGALALLLAPALLVWTGKASVALAMEAFDPGRRVAYQRAVDREFDLAWRETEAIGAAKDRPGTIYVFGSPLQVLLSGKRQAIAVHGWACELLQPRQWAMLPGELERSGPSHVYLAERYVPLIAERSPQTLALLKRDYEVAARSAVGTWFLRIDRKQASARCPWGRARVDRCAASPQP
jgi:hypothetical protein